LKVRWTRRAHRQLEQALTYVAEENPIAAGQIAQSIYASVQLLADNPTIGRPGRVAGTREWVVDGTPYLIGYSLQFDQLVILTLLHSKQQWPDGLD
jgi:plasmid stabilization system protein ParE